MDRNTCQQCGKGSTVALLRGRRRTFAVCQPCIGALAEGSTDDNSSSNTKRIPNSILSDQWARQSDDICEQCHQPSLVALEDKTGLFPLCRACAHQILEDFARLSSTLEREHITIPGLSVEVEKAAFSAISVGLMLSLEIIPYRIEPQCIYVLCSFASFAKWSTNQRPDIGPLRAIVGRDVKVETFDGLDLSHALAALRSSMGTS